MSIYDFPYEKVTKGSNIIIYGAGLVCKSYLEDLQTTQYCKVICLIDRDTSKSTHFDIPIIDPKEIPSIANYDAIVLAIANANDSEEIINMLYRLNVEKEKVIPNYIARHQGYCPICERETFFVEQGKWLRDDYKCTTCNSIPRKRAIVKALNKFIPNWRNLVLHESSPGQGGSSKYIKERCSFYSESQYFPNIPNGEYSNGVRCENLEKLTFKDCSIDVFITQDVFEHIMDPAKAFKEIERVLKVGGVHIFTVPIYENYEKTVQRAKMVDGNIHFICEPDYHGNPIDEKGSLVTFEYGFDIIDMIGNTMLTTIYLEKDRYFGLEAEMLHVLISKKLGS